MELDMIKRESFVPLQFDWIQISSTVGSMATKIKENKEIEEELAELIVFLLSVAKTYNINLQHAWYKWRKKANNKVYSS